MRGWRGDRDTSQLAVSLLCDADLAGCTKTAPSTAGAFLALVGPHTFLPLSAVSTRQTAVPHSTPEAELLAADAGVRAEGLTAVTIWEILLGRPVSLILCEDNESAARVIETGRNPTMRHIGRTHKVDLAFLHERAAGVTYPLRSPHPRVSPLSCSRRPSMLRHGGTLALLSASPRWTRPIRLWQVLLFHRA